MRKHRILVVEDEAIIGMHIKSTLGQFGYEVLGVAVSAKEAVAMSRELEPDLILMDIVMPGKHGRHRSGGGSSGARLICRSCT